jgi:hypothetical protein
MPSKTPFAGQMPSRDDRRSASRRDLLSNGAVAVAVAETATGARTAAQTATSDQRSATTCAVPVAHRTREIDGGKSFYRGSGQALPKVDGGRHDFE